MAADVTLAEDTTWSTDQDIDGVLSLGDGVRLTLADGADVTALDLRMGVGAEIVINSSDSVLTATNSMDSAGGASIQGDSDGVVLQLRGGAWSLASNDHILGNLDMQVSSLAVCGDCSVSANARGFGPELGPGPGVASAQGGSGGGHGGRGGVAAGQDNAGGFYGDPMAPVTAGSGGGRGRDGLAPGGRGGGVIRLQATTLTLEGAIRANGANGGLSGSSGGGGGAGGSIWVTVGRLQGAGRFLAQGGAGYNTVQAGGGGGGGHILVDYNDLTPEMGQDAAVFHLSSVRGGAGLGGNAQVGTLAFYDRGGDALHVVDGWRWLSREEAYPFARVTSQRSSTSGYPDVLIRDDEADNSAVTVQAGSLELSYTDWLMAVAQTTVRVGALSLQDQSNFLGTRQLVLDVTSTATQSTGKIESTNRLTLTGAGAWTQTGAQLVSDQLVLQEAGSFTLHNSAWLGNVSGQVASLTLADAQSQISASGRGEPQETGDGGGQRGVRGGAGGAHGGSGGGGDSNEVASVVYGRAYLPTRAGSGGGSGQNGQAAGGAGGGVINLVVTGALDNRGAVVADGLAGQGHEGYGGGGGGGGSVLVRAASLAGDGVFHARGGDGFDGSFDGGGGGGGRVAVHYDASTFSNMASCRVSGGGGYLAGAAGTLAFIDRGDDAVATSDDTVHAFQSWRWEASDGDHIHAGFVAHPGAVVWGPDSANQVLRFGGSYEIQAGAAWRPRSFAASLEADALVLRNDASISAGDKDLSLTLGSSMLLGISAWVEASSLTVSGSTLDATLATGGRLLASEISWQSRNLTLEGLSSRFEVSARGLAAETGDGAGYRGAGGGSGGSHGGVGGGGAGQSDVRTWYGRALLPTLAGSGGGAGNSGAAQGGRGGGVMHVVVSGTLNHEGYFEADGGDGAVSADISGGGGAGGSIWVEAGTLMGGGDFFARGGAGSGGATQGGGGGGGRVAIYYNNGGVNQPHQSLATGGEGHAAGALGTVAFIQSGGTQDRSDDAVVAYGGWRFQGNDAPYAMRSFTAYNLTVVEGPSAAEMGLAFSEGFTLGSGARWYPNSYATTLQVEDLTLGADAVVDSRADRGLRISGVALNLVVQGEISLQSGARVTTNSLSVSGSSAARLYPSALVQAREIQWVGQTLSLDAGGALDVSERGLPAQMGAGAGLASNAGGSGAGYGGVGSAGVGQPTPGAWYGSSLRPNGLGSGGGTGDAGGAPGGWGGGAMRLQLAGSLTLNGQLRANGGNGAVGGGGGGSGGSIWVTTPILAGAGNLKANGGAGASGANAGGGGGGGRIFVAYDAAGGFTDRRASGVNGGWGAGEVYGASGTLAFYDRTQDDLHIVEGWRWQLNDSPFEYRNISLSNSSSDLSAEIRDDGNGHSVFASGSLSLGEGVVWTMGSTTDLIGDTINLAGGRVQGEQELRLTVATALNLSSTGRAQADALHVRGGGAIHMEGSAGLISADLFLDEMGAVTMAGSSFMEGNLRGEVTGLSLSSTTAYVSADGYGSAPEVGPGAGYQGDAGGSGGSHGGVGGASQGQAQVRAWYGSAYEPTLAGSGGGDGGGGAARGGRGGGVINLSISQSLVNNGQIRANGGASLASGSHSGGGGAGGSIFLRTQTLSGSGRFQADGGDAAAAAMQGGRGGGGRVAIHYSSGSMSQPQNSTVAGGQGYASTASHVGTLALIQRGADVRGRQDDVIASWSGWRWQSNDGDHRHASFSAGAGAVVSGPGAQGEVLAFSGSYSLGASAVWDISAQDTALQTTHLSLGDGAQIKGGSALAVQMTGNGALGEGALVEASQVTWRGTSQVTLAASAVVRADKVDWQGRNLSLSASSSLFDVSGRGHLAEQGDGAGYRGAGGGSGGSHGGLGSQGSGQAQVRGWYGSAVAPVTAGSGGGAGAGGAAAGGRGGGVIRVQLSGELNLVGRMQANGGAGGFQGQSGGGGGAGGSIWVSVGTLKNQGVFQADGGNGYNVDDDGGGGGGGRVFVDFVQVVNIAPRNSRVHGGRGAEGTFGESGTLAFFDRQLKDMVVVEGWRWQQSDAPFGYRNLVVSNSTSDATPHVRDDGNALRIDVAAVTQLTEGTQWALSSALTDLRTVQLLVQGARVEGDQPLAVTLGVSARLADGALLRGSDVSLSGAGSWLLEGASEIRGASLTLNNIGDMDLTSGKLSGNLLGTVRNLYLRDGAGQIVASGYGFAAGSGPGAGQSSAEAGSGGGHGGVGGVGEGQDGVLGWYGAARAPRTRGSGGGAGAGGDAAGGAGGGSVDLVVGGEFMLGGLVYADGASGALSDQKGGGGGAGGSVYIRADKLRKLAAGRVYARGGSGRAALATGGGGGGGRVLLAYNEALAMETPDALYVNGGTGHGAGQVGTAAYYDIDDAHLMPYQAWRWEQSGQPAQLGALTVAPGVALGAEGGAVEIAVQGNCLLGDSADWIQRGTDLRLDCSNLVLGEGTVLDADTRTMILGVQNSLTLGDGAQVKAQRVTATGNANISLGSGADFVGNLWLSGRSLLVGSGAQLTADGYGAAAGAGEGAGSQGGGGGSGGSHGGLGGAGNGNSDVAAVYGALESPQTAGSGGGAGNSGVAAGGRGGGTIHLNFLNQIDNRGSITAHGTAGVVSGSGSGGGGSGGSVWLETATLLGGGAVSANGGVSPLSTNRGGGGGGGRIAACANVFGGFSGTVTTQGGTGFTNGAQGSYYSPADCSPALPGARVLISSGPGNPSNGEYAPGTTQVPVFQLRLREVSNNNDTTVRGLTFTASGSGDDAAHISQARLYRDANRDGLVDDGDALLGTASYGADNGALSFTGLGLALARQSDVVLLLTYDFAGAIPNGVTFQPRVAADGDADLVVANTTTAVPMSGAPLRGPSMRIFETPSPVVTTMAPRTVQRGVDSYVVVEGYYFAGATRVTLSDPGRTELDLISVYNDGSRAGVRVPAQAPAGDWDILVTTPAGTNTSSTVSLGIRESCNTGLAGICGAGQLEEVEIVAGPVATATAIPYSLRPVPSGGVAVTGDDELSGPIDVGFNFLFFGQEYSTVRVASNGLVLVGAQPGEFDDGCCEGGFLPEPNYMDGIVAGYWEDLNPRAGGQVVYGVQGSAPNREFVVMWDDVPHYEGPNVTFQVVFKENSNQIEVHCEDCPTSGWEHTQGVEDPTGMVAATLAGRNAQSFSLSEDGVRFVTGTENAGVVERCVAFYEPAREICGNGVDEDCSGADLACDMVDADGDGYSRAQGDCDDSDDSVSPESGALCSSSQQDLGIQGQVRAVFAYSPLDDDSGQVGMPDWTEDIEASWYQQAAETLVDSALQLDAEGDYAEIAPSIQMTPAGDRITLGAWVRRRGELASEVYTVLARGAFGAESYGVFYDAARGRWQLVLQTTEGRSVLEVAGYAPAEQTWTHVALVYDGQQLSFVHNGVSRGALPVTGALSYAGEAPVLVGGGHGAFRSWPGRVDELVLFNRAVTELELANMVAANRNHERLDWGNKAPRVRFAYDHGPGEVAGLVAGQLHGQARVSGRGSLRAFPRFASVVGTSAGFEIWDEPSGRLWARYWLADQLEGGTALELGSVDHVSAAAGRVFLASSSQGVLVVDFARDRVERWTQAGTSAWPGGPAFINHPGDRAWGEVNSGGLRLRSDQVRRLHAFARPGDPDPVPFVAISQPEGVLLVSASASPYVAAAYQASDDVTAPMAQSAAGSLRGGGLWRAGSKLYYVLEDVRDRGQDLVSATPAPRSVFEDPADGQTYTLDADTPQAVIHRSAAPSQNEINYGRSQGSLWASWLRGDVQWGAVRDVVVFEGASRREDAQPGDNLVALATPAGVVLLDEFTDQGDEAPGVSLLRGEDNGVSDESTRYVLHGTSDDVTALCRRGNELLVGTRGGGVTRLLLMLDPFERVSFVPLESFTTESEQALPSDNVTALSCGVQALVATEEGVVSLRFPEPATCTTTEQGLCAQGRRYVIQGQERCVQAYFPKGEICDHLDNDCDGRVDETPAAEEGDEDKPSNICDVVEPIFDPIDNISVTTLACDGVAVALPEPLVHSAWDPDPVVTHDAPAVFGFGTTTVTWTATLDNPCTPDVCANVEHPRAFYCRVNDACGDPGPIIEGPIILLAQFGVPVSCSDACPDGLHPDHDFCVDAGVCDDEIIVPVLCDTLTCGEPLAPFYQVCHDYNVCPDMLDNSQVNCPEACVSEVHPDLAFCLDAGVCDDEVIPVITCDEFTCGEMDTRYHLLCNQYNRCGGPGPGDLTEDDCPLAACLAPDHPNGDLCWDNDTCIDLYGEDLPCTEVVCGDAQHAYHDACTITGFCGPYEGPTLEDCPLVACLDFGHPNFDTCWDGDTCVALYGENNPCTEDVCGDLGHGYHDQCVLGGACDNDGPRLCTPDDCLNEESPNHGLCMEVGFCATLCDELACAFEGHPAHSLCVELGECEGNPEFTERLTATTTSQVTVVFGGRPELEAPADVTVEAVSPNGTPVTLGDPTASICIPGGVSVTHDGLLRYPLGPTTVTWTARGVQGEASTDSQVVTVVDTTPPAIEVGPDRIFDTANDVVLPTPVVSDNATPVELIVVTHDAPEGWPSQQWTTVTWTATDQAGNSATDSMRVYVRERGYPAPLLTILSPEQGAWLQPPAMVRARFTDSDCTENPGVVSNEEGLGLTVTRNGEGWDIVAVFSTDGVYNLTLTGTSGCSGKSSGASRIFGVDSAAPVPQFVTTISQEGVDPAVPISWRPLSRLRELPLGLVLDDRVSGLASVRVELVDHEEGTTTLLHEEALDQRLPGSQPVRGLPVRPIVGCSDETLCLDGKLQLRLLARRYYILRVTSVDVAGNQQSFVRYIQAINLYQAIDLWDRAVRATETDSEVAQELLNRISSTKLQPALRSYEHSYFGNIWLAVEDSISLLRVARLEDEGINHDFYLELVGELGVDFMRFKVRESIQDFGVTRYTNLSQEEADRAHEQWTLEAWQDVFTSLGNAWFWLTVGRYEFVVEDYSLNAAVGYQNADEVMDQIYGQMQAYVDTSEELPGRPSIQEALALLAPVRVYLQAVVDEGDLAQSDYEHMDAIMTLGRVAQRLEAAEESVVWVRNWRLGLTNIVALYAERALFSAASWITRSNPVWLEGQARYEEAEVFRVEYKPDSYMTTLIASRCDIIGVYNAIYEPNYEVPLECCARVREFHALDSEYRGRPSEIPIPDACLETITVEITDSGFSPSEIRLSVGQKVKFINKTSMAQTLVGGEPGTPDTDALNTGAIDPNGVYETQFGAAAEFGFFSSTQPEVINGGSLVVTE